MRLTLRTMLAYLDDVLDPADAEALRHKIGESDFASGLVDRIQGVLKKLRMEAPKLDGKGMGNDANTVAEYLDSALTQDRVAEFERVCLESDKHLAEVASCHQILTIVLGKAADVPTELRQRIYSLGDPAQATPQPPPVPANGKAAAHTETRHEPPAPANTNGKPPQPQLEVPEYLRSGRETSLWPFALVATIALAVTLALLWQRGTIDRFLQPNQPIAATDKSTEPTTPSVEPAPARPAPTTETPTTPDATTPPTAIFAAPAPTEPTPTVPPPATPDTTTPPAPSPADIASATPATPPAPTAVPETPEPTPTVVPQPISPVSPMPPTVKPPVVAAPATPRLLEVGRYTSDRELIATLDRDDTLWYAKQPQEILTAGEELVVLPPYRPQLTLPSAVQLTFAGEGYIKMEEPGENKIPRVSVQYGRFLARTVGRPAQVELTLAGVKGLLSLVDGDSVLAVKVTRWIPPGSDPEATPGEAIIELYNTNGRVTWQPLDQPAVDIPARHVHVYQGSESPQTYGPFMSPEWIDAKTIKPIDRDAAAALEKMVSSERPLNLTLQEAVTKDRKVRPLATRCLATLGEFDSILHEFGDNLQYSYWQGEFDTLRLIINRHPEAAKRLRETIALVRSADAKDFYRLLWGYSEDQLADAGSTQLVKLLEHDQLDLRVLAHSNLIAITGPLGYYRPERGLAQNKQAIQFWRDRKSRGEILYKTAPSPLDTYKPIGPAPPTSVR